MEQEVGHQIEQRLAELPEDVRNAVLSVEWEEKVHTIAERHKLHIDQAGALGDETLMAMLGLTSMDEYPKHLERALGIEPQDASLIAGEVSNEVFMSIRNSLRAFHESRANPPQTPSSVPMSSSASAPQPIITTPAPVSTPAPAATPTAVPVSMPAQTAVTATPPVPVPQLDAKKQEPPKPQNYATDPYREPPV